MYLYGIFYFVRGNKIAVRRFFVSHKMTKIPLESGDFGLCRYTYLRVKKGLALFTLQIHLKSADPEGVKGVGDASLLNPLARVGPKIARF